MISRKSVLLAIFLMAALPQAASCDGKPQKNTARQASNIALKDLDGKQFAFKSLHGHIVALWFFCPCEKCRPVAQRWAEMQRDARVRFANSKPASIVVFGGDGEAAKEFMTGSGLTNENNRMLPDVEYKAALAYDAIPCPRVFVVDAAGMIRYTNKVVGAKEAVTEPATVVNQVIAVVARLENSGGKKGKRK